MTVAPEPTSGEPEGGHEVPPVVLAPKPEGHQPSTPGEIRQMADLIRAQDEQIRMQAAHLEELRALRDEGKATTQELIDAQRALAEERAQIESEKRELATMREMGGRAADDAPAGGKAHRDHASKSFGKDWW